MPTRILGHLNRLSLFARFVLVSFVIMVSGLAGVGWWVSEQIEIGVVHQTAAATALYVDSFIAPHVQDFHLVKSPAAEHTAELDNLLRNTPLGQQIVAFKLWDAEGRILYSPNPSFTGRVFPIEEDLARAWRGEVTAAISDLSEEENAVIRGTYPRLLEVYSPVRLSGTEQIIAVAEFYKRVESLEAEILAAQRRSWLVVGAVMALIYLLLVGFVRWASWTIVRQQAELSNQVTQIHELHKRVRRAAASVTTVNERFLRRISAELHDGPAQDLGLAMLRLDRLRPIFQAGRWALRADDQSEEDLEEFQRSLRYALREVRTMAAGLALPQLEELTLPESLARVVRVHERRTGTTVALSLNELPEQATLPVKLTVYRLVQEALNNACRYGGGTGQQVRVSQADNILNVEVSDQGPGFDPGGLADEGEQLGLTGMRERVESLGGWFCVESEVGQGTRVIAGLPLEETGGNHEP